jgi:N-acetylglucosaminyldiphosphoundecaprenol N-acetyl-beta-D-mannosaminyltransferase
MDGTADPTSAGGPRAAAPRPPGEPDFDRPLVAILGLPFDAITLDDAVQRIRTAAFSGRRCFVSTPNLNFVLAARGDRVFRRSILRSDLSLVDGMPLVWTARVLGLPVPERVSGADVFDALQAHPGAPLTIYVFGGPPGAAASACERINARGGGLRCVGFDAGGFGSVESLSTDEHIERINRSGAHFVVVALGAVKGQAWIEHNARRLLPPVLSHLGAVVNFAAGAVARAPRWMRLCGLEWAWRIKEEPGLWRRYSRDALHGSLLFFRCIAPDALAALARRLRPAVPKRLETTAAADATTLVLHGDWRNDDGGDLRRALADAARRGRRAIVNLADVSALGATAIGPLLVAEGWFGDRGGLVVIGASRSLARSLSMQLVGELL